MDTFDGLDYVRFVAALAFVLALMGLCGLLFRKIVSGRGGLAFEGGAGRPRKRLALIESLPLDRGHRAVVLRWGGLDHLVILSHEGDSLLVGTHPAPEETPS